MRSLLIRTPPGLDHARLHATGRLDHHDAPRLGRELVTVLHDRGRVLVDLDGLEIAHPIRVLVFPAALTEAGGWPRARLVLHGGTEGTIRTLATSGVTNTVLHATSVVSAARLLDVRPPVVRRRARFDQHPTAPALARDFVAETCTSWHIPEATTYWAQLVTSELVTNAVEHARTPCRVVVEYTGAALRLSTHDDSDLMPVPQTAGESAERGRGLHIISSVTDHWGVEVHDGRKVTWAVMAATDGDPPAAAEDHDTVRPG